MEGGRMSAADIARLLALMAGLSAVSLGEIWGRKPSRDALALAILAAGAMLATWPAG
jgi:hypothetical protein